MISWIKQNKTEVLIFFLILAIASFLRFYRLPEYMNFLGDEGRDALMIQRILIDHDFPLIGPSTSVGNIYLGPLYYYMIAVPMAIFWLDPVAGAAMVAVIGVATVGLIYYLAREWFGVLPAILSSILYAVSPVTIIYSRSSWNPNPAPFFALLSILGLYKAQKNQNFRWFILTGIALAFIVQMHYLAFILLPIVFLLWFYEFQLHHQAGRYFWRGTLGAVFSFALLMSPLVIFDFRYNFLNFRAIKALLVAQDGAISFNLLGNLLRIIPIYVDNLIGRYMTGQNLWVATALSLFLILPFFWQKRFLGTNKKWPYLILGTWLGIGLLGLSLYRQNIYDHYLGFLNPVPYLLLGGLVAPFKGKGKIIVFVSLLILLGSVNLSKNPLFSPPNNQLIKTQEIAKFVIREAEDKPFNFALIAQRNYDAAYQFYLGRFGHKPKIVPFEITSQLFVVCEDLVCNPTVNPKYEIAGFGMTKISWEKEVGGVKIYKLVANPQGK